MVVSLELASINTDTDAGAPRIGGGLEAG